MSSRLGGLLHRLGSNQIWLLFGAVGQWMGYLEEIQDETPIVPNESKELTNLVHRLGRLPIQHILHLAEIY